MAREAQVEKRNFLSHNSPEFFFFSPILSMGFECQESEQNPNAITLQVLLFMYFLSTFTKMLPGRKEHECVLSRSGVSDS